MSFHDEWVQEPLFRFDDGDGLIDLVVLKTRWGRVAVDASWFDQHIAWSADWREHWQLISAMLQEHVVPKLEPTTLILIDPNTDDL